MVGGRVFNGILFREIFAKRKRNEFRNFAKKRSFSRNFVFRKNVILAKISETKRNAVKLSETKKTFKVKEGKKQLYLDSCLALSNKQEEIITRYVTHYFPFVT